jgi:hypothetical protein
MTFASERTTHHGTIRRTVLKDSERNQTTQRRDGLPKITESMELSTQHKQQQQQQPFVWFVPFQKSKQWRKKIVQRVSDGVDFPNLNCFGD